MFQGLCHLNWWNGVNNCTCMALFTRLCHLNWWNGVNNCTCMALFTMFCHLNWWNGVNNCYSISSCKMAAKGEKADYHLRLVQIKLRKNVCKSLWTKCASTSNYLIHVMLSYLLRFMPIPRTVFPYPST